MSEAYRSGLIALVGRPNVGKSTLLNALVGQKVSITSARPQTTRHRIFGIKSTADVQFVYVDTPGLHRETGKAINQYMNRVAVGSLEGVDCIVMVMAAPAWREEDGEVLARVRERRGQTPVVLAMNKMDRLPTRDVLLPLIADVQQRFAFAEIVPVSATRGTNVDELERAIAHYLPQQPPLFPEDQVSDRSDAFMAAELVREQVFRNLGAEVPYSTTVEIERFKREKRLWRVSAVIWVEKDGQKAIVIGKGGERLKVIGQRAREEMERAFGGKVFLQLWVKVREGWSDDVRALRSWGYTEEG